MTPEPEMSCKELVELVTDYLEGALSSRDRARFEAHLAECPWCVEYVGQIERTVAVVGSTWRGVEDDPRTAELLELFRDWRRVAPRNAAITGGTADHRS
jgi:anti-sigma factor RsiW